MSSISVVMNSFSLWFIAAAFDILIEGSLVNQISQKDKYMNFYFAPMEGLTGYVYRNAHHMFFNTIDKYFSPFIVANQSESFKTRELQDVLPEHNRGITLVPQLLTNNAKDFIHTARKLEQLGYKEINLNLGCPSGTVVSKYRGAGFLAKRAELDLFLDEVFSQSRIPVSIKTRIGKDRPEEFYDLIQVFNKYPIKELIIHPRIQTDFYKNKPNLDIFAQALTLSKNTVVYNGDIYTAKDYHEFTGRFTDISTVMLGRGLITNPGLTDGILHHTKLDKNQLKAFHDRIYQDYKSILSGDKNVLYKMKALWCYMIAVFTEPVKYAKKIKKSERLTDYDEAVASLFREQAIVSI
jgi:tRNA-dihydrouridine synthase